MIKRKSKKRRNKKKMKVNEKKMKRSSSFGIINFVKSKHISGKGQELPEFTVYTSSMKNC